MFGPLTANLTLRVNSTDRVSHSQTPPQCVCSWSIFQFALVFIYFLPSPLDPSKSWSPFCWLRCGVLCHFGAALIGVFGHEPGRSQNKTEPSPAEGIAKENVCVCLYTHIKNMINVINHVSGSVYLLICWFGCRETGGIQTPSTQTAAWANLPKKKPHLKTRWWTLWCWKILKTCTKLWKSEWFISFLRG